MLLVLALLLATELPPAAQKAVSMARDGAARLASAAESPGLLRGLEAPAYRPADRSVTNWQREALRSLQPAAPGASAAAPDLGAQVTRCVRLNNYWCIKSARWEGEIATDEEGHVGFASAGRGADAAASLLRRYYLVLGRRTALDIVRRWAPAECRLSTIGPGSAAAIVAVRGLGNTLRARWLAANRGRRSGLRVARPAPSRPAVAIASVPARRTAAGPAPARTGRVSVVPVRPLPTFRVPDIAAGLGERPARVPAVAAPARAKSTSGKGPAARPAPAASAPRTARAPTAPVARIAALAPPLSVPKSAPVLACSGDEQRIRNYATRIASAVALAPDQDLDLFDPQGRPRPNLAAVMLAMSGFELGALRASPDLVGSAIDRLSERLLAEAGPAAAPPP